MTHDIDVWMSQLRRQMERVGEAANVMAQPVAWAEVGDCNPVTTWAEGRREAITLLRQLAQLAQRIADDAETLPPWDGAHRHDWQPVGFTPHPRSGGLMPTDGCACGARRYPYSPEVE